MKTIQERADELVQKIAMEPDQATRRIMSIQLLNLLNETPPPPPTQGSTTKARIFERDLNVYSSYMKRLSIMKPEDE